MIDATLLTPLPAFALTTIKEFTVNDDRSSQCPVCGSAEPRGGFRCESCHASYMAEQWDRWNGLANGNNKGIHDGPSWRQWPSRESTTHAAPH